MLPRVIFTSTRKIRHYRPPIPKTQIFQKSNRGKIVCFFFQEENSLKRCAIVDLVHFKHTRSRQEKKMKKQKHCKALSIGSRKSDIPTYLVTYVFVCLSTVYVGPSIGTKKQTQLRTPPPASFCAHLIRKILLLDQQIFDDDNNNIIRSQSVVQ